MSAKKKYISGWCMLHWYQSRVNFFFANASMEEFKELFFTSTAKITEQLDQMGSRFDDLSTQVLLVQGQVEVLKEHIPAQGWVGDMPPPPHHERPPKDKERSTDDTEDEASARRGGGRWSPVAFATICLIAA